MPSYTPTDAAIAAVTLVTIILDVLAGYGVMPALDPSQRTALVTSLTVLASVGLAAFATHRAVKHVASVAATAKVAAAQATASPAPVPVAPVPTPAPFVGGPFVITPVTPGPKETTSTTGEVHPAP